ncbi:hypothetical protein D3C86_1594620 [compost metagenome]
MVERFKLGFCEFVFFGHEAKPRHGELPEEPRPSAMGGLQSLFEVLHRNLEAIFSQDWHDLFQGLLPIRQSVVDDDLVR